MDYKEQLDLHNKNLVFLIIKEGLIITTILLSSFLWVLWMKYLLVGIGLHLALCILIIYITGKKLTNYKKATRILKAQYIHSLPTTKHIITNLSIGQDRCVVSLDDQVLEFEKNDCGIYYNTGQTEPPYVKWKKDGEDYFNITIHVPFGYPVK